MANAYTKVIVCFAFSLILAVAFTASAKDEHFKDTAVKIYSKGYTHIDVAYYVEKLKNIFFTEEFKEKHPFAQMVEAFIDRAGYFAITDYTVESYLKGGKVYAQETVNLSDDYPDSLISRVAKLPDRHFKIGSLFTEDDYVLLLAVNNFQEFGKIVLGTAIESAKSAGQLPKEAEQMMGFLQFFALREDLKGALGTELDLILFDFPELKNPPSSPADVFFCVLATVADYPRAQELLKTAGGMLGFSYDKPAFESAEWKFFEIMNSKVYIGISGEWIALTTTPKKLVDAVIANRTKFHEDIPCGNFFMRVNVNRLVHEVGAPAIEFLRAEVPELAVKEIAYFFDVGPDTDFGTLEILCEYRGNRVISTTVMDDEVLNAMFYFLSIGLETAAIKGMEGMMMRKKRMPRDVEKPAVEKEERFDSRVPF